MGKRGRQREIMALGTFFRIGTHSNEGLANPGGVIW